jgi:hypothetical protein
LPFRSIVFEFWQSLLTTVRAEGCIERAVERNAVLVLAPPRPKASFTLMLRHSDGGVIKSCKRHSPAPS